jgi:hypothetical protein
LREMEEGEEKLGRDGRTRGRVDRECRAYRMVVYGPPSRVKSWIGRRRREGGSRCFPSYPSLCSAGLLKDDHRERRRRNKPTHQAPASSRRSLFPLPPPSFSASSSPGTRGGFVEALQNEQTPCFMAAMTRPGRSMVAATATKRFLSKERFFPK